jgi:ATP-dependent Clp protease ATP-binding subunit ClpB
MNFDKYTERARGFVQSAQTHALGQGHQQFTPEHILNVLLDDPEGLAASLIQRAGGRPEDARLAVETALGRLAKVSGGSGQLYLAGPTAKVFATAEELANKAGAGGLPGLPGLGGGSKFPGLPGLPGLPGKKK